MNVVTHRNSTRPARVKGLTDIAIRNARSRDRAYKLSDGRGLCLLVQPNGSKWWRFRYDWDGKEKMLSMGTYQIPAWGSLGSAPTKLANKSRRAPIRARSDV